MKFRIKYDGHFYRPQYQRKLWFIKWWSPVPEKLTFTGYWIEDAYSTEKEARRHIEYFKAHYDEYIKYKNPQKIIEVE
jgi:hypothetical protein